MAISCAVTEANSNYITADPWFPRLKYTFSLLGVCMAATGGTIAYRQWRLHLRQKRDACITCGYSLTGNTSGTCPECGTPAPQPSRRSSGVAESS